MHLHSIRRNLTLHVHMDPASSLHRHINSQHNIRHMFTQGQLLDQQYRKKC